MSCSERSRERPPCRPSAAQTDDYKRQDPTTTVSLLEDGGDPRAHLVREVAGYRTESKFGHEAESTRLAVLAQRLRGSAPARAQTRPWCTVEPAKLVHSLTGANKLGVLTAKSPKVAAHFRRLPNQSGRRSGLTTRHRRYREVRRDPASALRFG